MRLDLLLVNPGNRLEQFANLNELATVAPPLGIAMLASYVREHGYTVAIIDAEAEFWTAERTVEEIKKYSPLLVGLTAFTTKMTSAEKILTLLERETPFTAIGGHHISAIPHEIGRTSMADFVMPGEGFIPMVQVLEGLKSDNRFILRTLPFFNILVARAPLIKDLDSLPFAAWDLLPMAKYRAHHWQAWEHGFDQTGFAVLHTSLGCPFSCVHCSVNVVYGKHIVRYRGIESVVKEMQLLVADYGVKYIELIDDTLTIKPERVRQLCEGIVNAGLGNKLRMWCFARADLLTPQMAAELRQAGVEWVFMGFESGNNVVLKGINKKLKVEQDQKAVDIAHAEGLHVGGNFIFGLPGDTQETMQATLDLAIELNPEYANFFIPMAYPGTKLYEIAKQKGYSLPERWGQYGFFAPDALPLRNEVLTAKDILTFRDNAFKIYFRSARYQDMIKRTFGQPVVDFINNRILSKELKRV